MNIRWGIRPASQRQIRYWNACLWKVKCCLQLVSMLSGSDCGLSLVNFCKSIRALELQIALHFAVINGYFKVLRDC